MVHNGTRSQRAAPARTSRLPAAGEPQRRALADLTRVSEMVAGELALDVVLRSAMDTAADAMNAEACSILLHTAPGQLTFHLVDGPQSNGLARTALPIDDRSIAGWVANHQTPLVVADAYQDSRFNPDYDARTGFRTRSILCVPLRAKGEEVGVIEVLNRRDGRPFAEHDLAFAQAVAGLIAVAIQNARQHEALMKAQRLATIGQTIAGMAHCVKNILNGLQGGSYMIDQEVDPEAGSKTAAGWRIVKRNIRFLSNIVLDMLSYSKERKPLRRPCPLADLYEDVVELLQDQAAERGVTLTTGTRADEVCADEAALKRCLVNLVGNAIDACGEGGGLVELQAGPAEKAGHVALRVSDNGCGMAEADRRRIFDPFFSTKGGKGTGLGLAVTRKIVQEHGGVIEVESSPGRGTVFTLVLPTSPPEPADG